MNTAFDKIISSRDSWAQAVREFTEEVLTPALVGRLLPAFDIPDLENESPFDGAITKVTAIKVAFASLRYGSFSVELTREILWKSRGCRRRKPQVYRSDLVFFLSSGTTDLENYVRLSETAEAWYVKNVLEKEGGQ